MNKYIALLAVSVVLSGCETLSPQQIEQNKRQHCANMGAPQGSKDYYQCRSEIEYRLLVEKKLESDRYSDAAATYAAFNPPQQQQPARQSMSCTSSRMGNFVNTNCH